MGSHPDILIYIDDVQSKDLYDSFIELGKYFVHFATKDDSGFSKLQSAEFDLIVYEISQPLFSEIYYIDKLYQFKKHIPIVIVSEYFNETKNTVFGNTISDFIAKPLTINKLFETVSAILEPADGAELRRTKTDVETQSAIEAKRLSILYEISKSLNSITDFDLLLSTIVTLATDALNAERATLFVLDKNTDELWSRVGTGIDRHEIRFQKDKGIAGEVVNTNTSILCDKPYEHPLFNKDFDRKTGFQTKNLLCVPMRNLNGETVGAFQVLNKKEGDRFDSEDELFLSAMAASAAISLENTLLHEEKKLRYEEMQKLYNDLYVAQKMIVWESKHSTISEIRGYLNDIKQYDGVSKSIVDITSSSDATPFVIEKADHVKEAYDKTFVRLGEYLNHLMNQLEEEEEEEQK